MAVFRHVSFPFGIGCPLTQLGHLEALMAGYVLCFFSDSVEVLLYNCLVNIYGDTDM